MRKYLVLSDRGRNIPRARLLRTEAFKKRNKDWEYLHWDFTEWEECIHEAEKELNWEGKNKP